MRLFLILIAVILTCNTAEAKRLQHHPRHHQQTAFNFFNLAEQPSYRASTQYVSHPSGCPRRDFCACGAAVRIFGKPIRSLWLAANWFKFPRTHPHTGAVAVRRHHVFVLERHISGSTWLVYDANSGHHRTRIHPRSIAGYVIVDPQA